MFELFPSPQFCVNQKYQNWLYQHFMRLKHPLLYDNFLIQICQHLPPLNQGLQCLFRIIYDRYHQIHLYQSNDRENSRAFSFHLLNILLLFLLSLKFIEVLKYVNSLVSFFIVRPFLFFLSSLLIKNLTTLLNLPLQLIILC